MDFVNEFSFGQEQYKTLLLFLKRKTGLDLEGYRTSVAQRRIARRARKVGCRDLRQYLAYLRKNADEARILAEFVTLPVGRFFRNREVFGAIEKKVLPVIFAEAGRERRIRIWSAGCGEGEEAYTMAMMLKEKFSEQMKKSPVEIVATDINSMAIKNARQGRYEKSRLEETHPLYRKKYFTEKDKFLQLDENIIKMVRFRVESLREGRGVRGTDLAVMRNLLIYFDRAGQEAIMEKITGCLARRGFLVLSKTETMPEKFKTRYQQVSSENRIYRKASL